MSTMTYDKKHFVELFTPEEVDKADAIAVFLVRRNPETGEWQERTGLYAENDCTEVKTQLFDTVCHRLPGMFPTTLEKVAEFNSAFGINTPEKPTFPPLPSPETFLAYTKEVAELAKAAHKQAKTEGNGSPLLRVHLILEELSELMDAIFKGDHVAALDALVDLRYVLDGTTLSLGLGSVFEEAFDTVHRSNLSKLEDGVPVKDESGRVLKGKDYVAPDLGTLVARFITSLDPT
jgi:predicted HAD superfamily Cof-like phosphohydrolase